MRKQDFQHWLGQATQLINHQKIQTTDELSGNTLNRLTEIN